MAEEGIPTYQTPSNTPPVVQAESLELESTLFNKNNISTDTKQVPDIPS